jgi:large subunit ribosomal protein L25
MENLINVQFRDGAGKGVSRKTRAVRRVPAICYGNHFEKPVTLSVDKLELSKVIRTSSATSLYKLKSEQKTVDGQMVLIKSKQRDPITDDVIHVDFMAVQMDQKLKVRVPVELKGKAKGVVEGGLLQQPNRWLNVRCFPNNIPTKIIADVSALEINDSLHVNDIQLPEGVSIVGTVNYTLAVVVPPEKEEVAATPVEGAAAAVAGAPVQPEVTAQKSAGKEDAAAAPAAGDKKAGDKKAPEKKEAKK